VAGDLSGAAHPGADFPGAGCSASGRPAGRARWRGQIASGHPLEGDDLCEIADAR